MIYEFPQVFRCLSLHSSVRVWEMLCVNIQATGCQSRCLEICKYLASRRLLKSNFWLPVSQHANVFCGDKGRVMSGECAFLQCLAEEICCHVEERHHENRPPDFITYDLFMSMSGLGYIFQKH